MTAVNLELPADLVSAAKLDRGNVSHEAANQGRRAGTVP
jgi:hypothetical protein